MREKNYLGLCMRYSESCKLCPRNKKCEEELKQEKGVVFNGTNKKENKRIKKSKI